MGHAQFTLKFLPAACCPLVDLALANSPSRCRGCRECRVPLTAEKPGVTDVTQTKLFPFQKVSSDIGFDPDADIGRPCRTGMTREDSTASCLHLIRATMNLNLLHITLMDSWTLYFYINAGVGWVPCESQLDES